MAWAYVQDKGAQSVGSVASLGVAFTNNVVAGNFLAALPSRYQGIIGTTTVTDSQSNSYTQDIAQGSGSNTSAAAHRSANIASSGACTVTFTPAASSFVTLSISEWSGGSSTPLDVTKGATGTSTAQATGNFTTTDTDLILVYDTDEAPSDPAYTLGSGYTLLHQETNSANLTACAMYKIVVSGTYTGDITNSLSDLFAICAASYKPAAAATLIGASMKHRPMLLSGRW